MHVLECDEKEKQGGRKTTPYVRMRVHVRVRVTTFKVGLIRAPVPLLLCFPLLAISPIF